MELTSYILAADNHNLGNQGTSWLDLDTWEQKFGNVGKLAASSILSGANSFYNTGIAVGNWFGADIQQNDTQDWISSIDSDLGMYYRQNKEAADLTGFVLGSLIPGLGGVKLFNAGQVALKTASTGLVGTNMGKALGLLVPNAEKYVKLAAADINGSVSALKLLNTNTAKAIGAGLWQNTLEAAAFETVVQVSMAKSPVLEQQDVTDIASNIVLGGVLGGVIGGAFTSAKLIGQLKKSRYEDDIARMPFQARPSFAEKTPANEKIVQLAFDSDMAAQPVRMYDAAGKEVVNNFAVNTSLYETKITKNFNDIRENINSLTVNDNELGNLVADISHPVKDSITGRLPTGYANNYFNQFSGAAKLARITETTGIEIAAKKAEAAGEANPLSVRYIKLTGEGAGQVTASRPISVSLADMYKGKDAVLSAVRKYGFDVKKAWNPLELAPKKAALEAEARYIWAKEGKFKLPENSVIHEYDIPLLERLYSENRLDFKIIPKDGSGELNAFSPKTKQELFNIIKEAKLDVANFYVQKYSLKKEGELPIEFSTESAARIANTKQSYLEGFPSANEIDDLFAHQSAAREQIKSLEARGLSTKDIVDPLFSPKYAKVVYQVDQDVSKVSENVLDAMAYYKGKQREYTNTAKNVVSKIFGKAAETLPDISDDALFRANRQGSGAGLFSFENSNYGTLGSTMSWIGSTTRQMQIDFRKTVDNYLNGPLTSLLAKQSAAIEFDSINQKVLRSAKLWKLNNDDNGRFLYTGNIDDILAGSGDNEIINIANEEVSSLIENHIKLSGQRTEDYKLIRAAQGHTNEKDSAVFRPIYPDLKQYSHFAFVKDEAVTGAGHTTMLHAASEKELAALIERVPVNYKVYTKSDTEQFAKARNEYEFSRTLHENYIDHDLKSKGVFSNFFVKTDPGRIANDVLQQHYRESDTLVKETVRLRYEPQFNFLEDLGKTYARTATSKFASRSELIENTSDNPFFNYIKTALNISKVSENHLIYGFNKLLDESFSKATAAIRKVFEEVKSPEDIGKLNETLDRFGIKPAYYDAALVAHVNHTAPKGELTKFVQKANSLLSLFTLGLDPLNSINNAIGSNILRFTELKYLTKAINSGNSEVAGDLAKISKIQLPGTEDLITAPRKLVAKAIENFWKDDGTLLKAYRDKGFIRDRVEQLKALVDDFTLKGTETVGELNSKLSAGFQKAKDLAEKGEKLSGNKLAEEFNRFISANVMEQITAVGKKHGLISDAEANAYINTFVNRVEGNTLASQRPLIFQGPIGQAIGLFQSYQFNLIQQLFRYVGEGSKKDIATLLGLQSTLYGLQSLPAFQFINTHIVGQMSGNKEHRDAYDAVYGITGRTAGDFVLYGLPSNFLQANVYSRGDINPRQITVLPTSLQEIPIVAGWGRLLGSLYNTTKNISGGANVWESILQGMEHNGISRPLAGLAQTMQAIPGGTAYSTTSQGSILGSNDLFSFASVVRLAGGRPLDEAIVNDALFRTRVYEAARYKDMRELARNVKTTLIQGETNSDAQLLSFAQRYAELGGKQAGFNKWMMSLYKSANVSQAEQLKASLTNPFSYKMQLLMGGDDGE